MNFSFTSWKLRFAKEIHDVSVKKFKLYEDVLFKEVEGQIKDINKKRGEDFSTKALKDIIK